MVVLGGGRFLMGEVPLYMYTVFPRSSYLALEEVICQRGAVPWLEFRVYGSGSRHIA
jgi:hypothetical protein